MVLPEKGDIICFGHGLYDHNGIYIGDGKVIHKAGPPGGPSMVPASASSSLGLTNSKAAIRVDDLANVAGDTKAEIYNYKDDEKKPYSRDEIVRRAKSKLGQERNNVLYDNCEHFATWCRYGEASSSQVETVGAVESTSFIGQFTSLVVALVRKTIYPH